MPNEWISVKDRLPKQGELVLCYNIRRSIVEHNKPFIGKYIGGSYSEEVYAFVNIDRNMATGTTHWMPLPKPPKGE